MYQFDPIWIVWEIIKTSHVQILLFFSIAEWIESEKEVICRKKSGSHRASNKNIRTPSWRKGHPLYIFLSFDSVRALDAHVMYSVRTRDAQ